MKWLIEVGSQAPNFELAASDGERHALNALLADTRVLLIFYPGNNTPG